MGIPGFTDHIYCPGKFGLHQHALLPEQVRGAGVAYCFGRNTIVLYIEEVFQESSEIGNPSLKNPELSTFEKSPTHRPPTHQLTNSLTRSVPQFSQLMPHFVSFGMHVYPVIFVYWGNERYFFYDFKSITLDGATLGGIVGDQPEMGNAQVS